MGLSPVLASKSGVKRGGGGPHPSPGARIRPGSAGGRAVTLEPGGPDCAGSEYLAWWRFFVPFLAYLDPAIQTSDPEIFSRILHPCDSKLRSVIPNPVRSDSIPLLILV